MGQILKIVTMAVEAQTQQMDGPDDPGFHHNGVTILDADPAKGLILVEINNSHKVYKIQLVESTCDLSHMCSRFEEKVGGGYF
jgi:hypothetical protein